MAKRKAQPDTGPSIIQVMESEALLASHFKRPTAASWDRWRICLSAAFGLPPPKIDGVDAVEFYKQHTARQILTLGQ